ncbi:hypothetical protein [Mesorhizobium sp. B2-4-6]|uniref:hypothetical protein n=1 Tax=Mesorhizobium sp. B2-4-6 TaxID=2589943 RepID=UPI00112EC15E|nr:hypothetical protein [Mesorhizobium sp. B2-4-6]TPL45337.1 hypothetical protein FJ957_20725 [Mesorhizobium sp. B2-4-6]
MSELFEIGQRERELFAELHAAEVESKEAGRNLLAKIWVYGPERSNIEDEARDRFFEAEQREMMARRAWAEAYKAFGASAAGLAKARYFARLKADPIARASPPAVEEVA